ncbi:hypothetical protein E6H19_09320 [Candidatus Bathyarchaeota archaeon]|nr:MAG: hypothetical protein E6H19_09320 [Candidatus Bathyarchaeota archaeon]
MKNSKLLALLLVTISLSIALAATPAVQARPGSRLTAGSTKVVPAGSLTTTDIMISFMVPFDAFDISVRADGAAITPQSISIGTVLPSPIIVANCINGSGTGCSINDGSGIAHLAAASGTGVSSSASRGVLFTVTWMAVNSVAGSPIVITCQQIAVAGSQISSILVINTDYGTVSSAAEPSFTVSAPSSAAVPAGFSQTIAVSVNALNGWANNVNVSAVTSSPSVTASVSPTFVACDCVNTASSQLTISTTTSGTFTVTVTGSFVFHGTKLSSSATITVTA